MRSFLSIVVFVAINPEKLNFLISSTILSIVLLDSSGDTFRKIGLVLLSSEESEAIWLSRSDKLSSLCRSLKLGVFGDEMLITM